MDNRKRKKKEDEISLAALSKKIRVYTKTEANADGGIRSFSGIHIPDKAHARKRRQESTAQQSTPNEQVKRTKIPLAYRSNTCKVVYAKLEFPKYKCNNCGASMWIEEKSSNSTASNTIFTLCCKAGKVSLAKLKPPPEPLHRLMREQGRQGKKFRSKIRVYNSLFGFTSFGGRIDEKINETRGPYTFRISGQNYHRIGTLLPLEGMQPRYSQLYFYDTENEVKNRIGCLNLTKKDVDEQIVKELMEMLDDTSAVAKAFRMVRDWKNENGETNVELRLIGERRGPRRQYNMPAVSEIAGLIVGDFGEASEPRDIIVKTKAGPLQRISELHPQYMALQYPLLFPYGEDGFHTGIPYTPSPGATQTQRGHVTMKEFYCYRIQQRTSESTHILEAERLLHVYLVDAYTAVEEQRLTWVRFHQTELRVELYNNVYDAVTRGDTDAQSIGKRIVLPATFTGGPRYMQQNYQDAMAICRKFGNPTLFITFTANPKWPEVSEMLAEMPRQTAADRPDIMTRVFRLKLSQLMKDLRKKEIFGPTKAAVYTIEFQKRGLPHAHILLWLDMKDKTVTPEEIDEVISAEIPCKIAHPEEHSLVVEHMLHGPCGDDNPASPCMIDGKCSKHFPKPFYTNTTTDEEGFPVYRRRDEGASVTKGKGRLDNRHVVPYNPYLLLKYRAHINVEWCNQSRAIKYLFKYISKGPDRATIMLMRKVRCGEGVDEITEYLECRYLSACEATWRILGFDIHSSTPSVIRLPLHLPNQQPVTVHDNQDLASVLRRDGVDQSMITEWFNLNARDERALCYTYADIPTKYVWHQDEKIWKWRKQQTSIGRIVYCHPTAGERYYLRILLNFVKGPKSFEEIRTVNGVVYETFRAACCARGMLNDDKEWTDAIQEAKLWAMGNQLRDLFVTILLFCDVTSPKRVWEENWEALSEDILHQKRNHFRFPGLQLTDHQIKNYCLLHINDLLVASGKSLDDYPDMPKPDKSLLTNIDNRLIQEELSYNIALLAEEHRELHGRLNDQQLMVYEKILKSVEEDQGEFVFVYGAGGTGKTFLYKTIMARLHSERKIVLAVASSGIASLLLQGGRTAHSRFLIPLELQENSTCSIKQNSQLAQLLHEVKLIIWDEAPMTQRYAFEALNRTLQDIKGIQSDHNRRRPFGGITMLLGGDFRQILPVITKGRRQEIVQACINNSPIWRECEVVTLNRSMRVNDRNNDGTIDERKNTFNKWILQVGDGDVEAIAMEEGEEPSWIDIPPQYIVTPTEDPIKTVIGVVYPNFNERKTDPSYLQERAILTPLNEDADRINHQMFAEIQSQEKIYYSADEVCLASTDSADQDQMYPIEFLNGLDFPGMPPHELSLKEGLPIMLLRNVNPTKGLCNGTRLIITKIGVWVIEAKIITGAQIGTIVLIPRITMSSTKSKWPFVLKRRQYPIKPCFAMTINKSQGQSLKHVGLYLPKPVFCHRQLYVAMSRVTNPDGLKIVMQHTRAQPTNITKNIVFKEAFNNLGTTNEYCAAIGEQDVVHQGI